MIMNDTEDSSHWYSGVVVLVHNYHKRRDKEKKSKYKLY